MARRTAPGAVLVAELFLLLLFLRTSSTRRSVRAEWEDDTILLQQQQQPATGVLAPRAAAAASGSIPPPAWLAAAAQNEDEDGVTYYSPNVPLDEQRPAKNDEDNDNQATDNDNSDTPATLATTSSSSNAYSFFDEAVLVVRAGSGGQGAATFKKGVQNQNGPPDGGTGGRGGHVVLCVDASLNTLAGLSSALRPNRWGGSGAAHSSSSQRPRSFRAENGADGGRQFQNGQVRAGRGDSRAPGDGRAGTGARSGNGKCGGTR